ncbi:MAG: nickel pincer cofactor biosynthesis protein LarC [Candidatus Eremiobacteraeota bacterium]|nr:nickel pincer cofactor biosynthesis protein LarC [Candidatus Eremiobacteraeota bacterium]
MGGALCEKENTQRALMRIAYFDCFAGASGNMILGSLVDAGLDLGALQRELRRLPVAGWSMHAQRVSKHGLAALYLDIDVPGEDGRAHDLSPAAGHQHEGLAHRQLRDVLTILQRAHFSHPIEERAARIYRRLAQAEAAVHGTTAEEVVFHEVGQVDAIIDIAGAALALDLLGIEKVYASALPCGTGRIHSAHGSMPSPAPATMELLRGVPSYQLELAQETVTPTGAAILTEIASFDPRPPMRIDKIGYGSGRSDFPFPNVVRVLIGQTLESPALAAPDTPGTVMQTEANIDDMNPQLFEAVMEQLFAGGALDAWLQPVTMKHGRPGVVVSVLCEPERADAISTVLLANTTTIGVRRWAVQREVLARRSESVETSLGVVRVKIVDGPAGTRARAEYADCARIAAQRQLPLLDVMNAVEREVAAWLAARTQA